MSVGVRPGPPRRRPDVVTGKDGVTPTPLQVKYYAPDEQSNEWGENDQKDGHHNLLPEVFSAYGPDENNHASDEPPELRHVTHQWSSEPADHTWTRTRLDQDVRRHRH